MREIPHHELRDTLGAVLGEVEAGATLRVTVQGRPVADLVPVATRKWALAPDEVSRIVAEAPLDSGFAADLDAAAGTRIDEL